MFSRASIVVAHSSTSRVERWFHFCCTYVVIENTFYCCCPSFFSKAGKRAFFQPKQSNRALLVYTCSRRRPRATGTPGRGRPRNRCTACCKSSSKCLEPYARDGRVPEACT